MTLIALVLVTIALANGMEVQAFVDAVGDEWMAWVFILSVILAVIVIGASLGFAQWLLLRQHVSRSGWWVLASAN